jgi:hypothetical protein
MSLWNQAMESTGKFLRPAQGDAVTAIDLVGDAAERPELPRVARIAQAIAQKEPPAGHVA